MRLAHLSQQGALRMLQRHRPHHRLLVVRRRLSGTSASASSATAGGGGASSSAGGGGVRQCGGGAKNSSMRSWLRLFTSHAAAVEGEGERAEERRRHDRAILKRPT